MHNKNPPSASLFCAICTFLAIFKKNIDFTSGYDIIDSDTGDNNNATKGDQNHD